MKKLSRVFTLSVSIFLMSAQMSFAYDRNCFVGLTQCTNAMMTSLESNAGVRFSEACEEQATADYSDFSFIYQGTTYARYFDSFADCLHVLRTTLSRVVNDISFYSACEHSRGGERTITGGVTPAGLFCFEYRFSE